MAGDTQYRLMMSQSVVLECQQGSQVWLEASANECFVHGNIDERESVFGGFILQRLWELSTIRKTIESVIAKRSEIK